MKLMRHSDIKLTAKVYTDETQLPIYEAIKGLPRLLDHTQIRAQILGAEGQNVAQAVAASEGKDSAKPPANGEDCHGLAQCDAMGKMERAKGFEIFRTRQPIPFKIGDFHMVIEDNEGRRFWRARSETPFLRSFFVMQCNARPCCLRGLECGQHRRYRPA
jgi:hypothetical protein